MSEAERVAETETAGIVAALDVLIDSAATAYTYGDAPIGVTLVFKPIVRARDRLVYLENENAALRSQEQNEPLTLEQLLGMDGMPVWVVESAPTLKDKYDGWAMIRVHPAERPITRDSKVIEMRNNKTSWEQIGNTTTGLISWVKFYAREPKHAPGSGKE